MIPSTREVQISGRRTRTVNDWPRKVDPSYRDLSTLHIRTNPVRFAKKEKTNVDYERLKGVDVSPGHGLHETNRRFTPSRYVVSKVKDVVLEERRAQTSVVRKWLNSLSVHHSTFDKPQIREIGHASKDPEATLKLSQWIVRTIHYFFDNVGTSITDIEQPAVKLYKLTEHGRIKPALMSGLYARMGITSDDAKFTSSLRDDLWRAGLEQSIHGVWGKLAIREGELVIETSQS